MSARSSDRFSLRLPPDLRDRIAVIAHVKRQSINSEIVNALARAFPHADLLAEMDAELCRAIEADHVSYMEQADAA